MIQAIELDAVGNKWFGEWLVGVRELHPDGTWQTFTPSNSGLPNSRIWAIAADNAGNIWFWGEAGPGEENGVSVLHTDGSWVTYNRNNSGLPGCDSDLGPIDCPVGAIAIDENGNTWFGGWPGVSVLCADGSWDRYTTSNSGLANDHVEAIALDGAGNKWFGGGGISVLRADGSWQVFNTSNSGLAHNVISSLAIDAEGNIWAGTYRGSVSVLRTDGSWRTYDNSNPGINDIVHGLAFDPQGNLWVGRWFSGVSVMFRDTEKVVSDSPQWVALNRYRSSYSFTTLVPRGTYSLSVSGARGTDGIEIPPYAGVT